MAVLVGEGRGGDQAGSCHLIVQTQPALDKQTQAFALKNRRYGHSLGHPPLSFYLRSVGLVVKIVIKFWHFNPVYLRSYLTIYLFVIVDFRRLFPLSILAYIWIFFYIYSPFKDFSNKNLKISSLIYIILRQSIKCNRESIKFLAGVIRNYLLYCYACFLIMTVI